MATENITVTAGGWQNLSTLGSLTLTENQYYTVTIYCPGENEVCLATTEPETTFKGHKALDGENFGFTYTGEDIWVKLSRVRPNTVTVVIS